MIKDYLQDARIEKVDFDGVNLSLYFDNDAYTYMIANGFRIEDDNECRMKLIFHHVMNFISEGNIEFARNFIEDNHSLSLSDDKGSISFSYSDYMIKKINTMG